MKRVFRIQGKGKVKDVGLRDLAEHPELERVNTTVALIQALIPLGLRAAGEALAAEVTRLAWPEAQSDRGQPRLRPLVSSAGLHLPRRPKAPRHLPAGAGSPAERGGAAGDLSAPPAPPSRRCRAVPEDPPRPELPGLRGLRRGRARGLRPQPLHRLPPLHPGQRDAAPDAARATPGPLRRRGPGPR